MIKRINKWLGIPARDVTPAGGLDVDIVSVQKAISGCPITKGLHACPSLNVDVSGWDITSIPSAAEFMEGFRAEQPND